ncbi:MAG TPA: sodium:calcium antiporter, partial [Myxococcota bacterium]|nr:sodium:calcium antiporter [Myxococcota bacterium]
MDILYFVLGLAMLIGGAELLVRGASRLALSLGVSPLVVGLTIVAYGTSAPEVAVSVDGVLSGNMDIAVGNVVGSNIFNILFILGISALIAPLLVHRQVIRQEVPIMVGAMALMLFFSMDGVIQAYEAGLLVVLLIGYTWFLIRQSRAEVREEDDSAKPTSKWDAHWS